MNKILIAALMMFSFSACTSQHDAEKALRAQGFKDIEVTGYGAFSCSEDDFFRTNFRATNPNGEVVEGTVCSGLFFKNSTIRW